MDFGRAAAFAATYYPALSEEKARCVQLLLGAFFHLGAEAEQIVPVIFRKSRPCTGAEGGRLVWERPRRFSIAV